MTPQFELVLDTVAPTFTIGVTGGTTAGELLTIAYTLDEQAIDSATLTLGDSRVLTVTVGATLTVLLPPDTPDGNATLTVNLSDDVGNERTQDFLIALTGVVVVPAPSQRGGIARTRPTFVEFKIQRHRSSAAAISRERAIAKLRTRSSVDARSEHRLAVAVRPAKLFAPTQRLQSVAVARARSQGRVRGAVVSHTHVTMATRAEVQRRAEGPRTEETLLLLDVI